MSSAVLLPIGMFLINRANKDSVVFNIEGYRNFFMHLLGLRSTRKINRKEVIINNPDYKRIQQDLETLSLDCQDYVKRYHLRRIPNYWRLFFRYQEDSVVIRLNNRLEDLIEELHNSRDNVILTRINEFPIVNPDAHTRPFHNARWNMFTGIFFPLGLFFFFRIWRYRLRLFNDMQNIQRLGKEINERITAQQYE